MLRKFSAGSAPFLSRLRWKPLNHISCFYFQKRRPLFSLWGPDEKKRPTSSFSFYFVDPSEGLFRDLLLQVSLCWSFTGHLHIGKGNEILKHTMAVSPCCGFSLMTGKSHARRSNKVGKNDTLPYLTQSLVCVHFLQTPPGSIGIHSLQTPLGSIGCPAIF